MTAHFNDSRGALLHSESLSARSTALRACPDGPTLFLLDAGWLRQVGASKRQVGFMVALCDAVAESAGREVDVRIGRPEVEIPAFIERHRLTALHVDRAASPWFDDWIGAAGPGAPWVVHDPDPIDAPPIRRLRFKPFWDAMRKTVQQAIE